MKKYNQEKIGTKGQDQGEGTTNMQIRADIILPEVSNLALSFLEIKAERRMAPSATHPHRRKKEAHQFLRRHSFQSRPSINLVTLGE